MIPDTHAITSGVLIKCFDCRKYHPESETIKVLDYWLYTVDRQSIQTPEYDSPIYVCKECVDAYIKRNEGT